MLRIRHAKYFRHVFSVVGICDIMSATGISGSSLHYRRMMLQTLFGHTQNSPKLNLHWLGTALCSKSTCNVMTSIIYQRELLYAYFLNWDWQQVLFRINHYRLLNSHLAALNIENLMDIGTCSLHVIHNALRKRIHGLNTDIESFVVAIFQRFHMSAARREDYHKIEEILLLDDVNQGYWRV